jgi:hypothetical protein
MRSILLTSLLAACPGSDCRTYAPEQACVGGKVTNVWCGDTGYVASGNPAYTECGTLDGGVRSCVAQGQSCAADGGSRD